MIIQDLINLWRKQVSDEDAPYLWDDVEVLQYIIDAQDLLVRKMGGISDSRTTALTDIVATASTPFTAFSPYILRIRSAKMIADWRDIPFVSEADIKQRIDDDYGLTTSTYNLDDTSVGEVKMGILGLSEKAIRWWYVPSTTQTCRMHIYRLPYPRISTQESLLEIDEQHHIHLLPWVKHMAYSKEDAETYDRDLASTNKKLFEEYCEQARKDIERQRFKPRTVAYGGI